MSNSKLTFGWFLPTSGDSTCLSDPSAHLQQSRELFDEIVDVVDRAWFSYMLMPVNAACCPNARSCSGGIPTVCTTACRTAWTDFSESPCRAQVLSTTGTDASSRRLASIFTSVGQLCGRSDGGRTDSSALAAAAAAASASNSAALRASLSFRLSLRRERHEK